MAFIADLMPKLKGYLMELHRVTYASAMCSCLPSSPRRWTSKGSPMRIPEALVFELNGDGRIARVDIFIQTPGG